MKIYFFFQQRQTRDKNSVTPEQMAKLCSTLKDEGFDYIIIDCPAGIEQGFKMLLLVLIVQLLSQLLIFQLLEMLIE